VKIEEVFRRPISRRIEEVIKVDLDTKQIVADEIDEYVVTEHIAEGFETFLDRYQETILKPDEGTTAWISGFFGSGKSSFAKILGYLLSDPNLDGRSATEHFAARVDSKTVQALLNTIHAQVPTHAVFVDLSTGRDVLNEGESVVLPLYRALLTSLGYSRNVLLAQLEFDLESDGVLKEFVDAFNHLPGGHGVWEERRNVGLARNEASHALHLIRPDTFPHADSWSNGAQPPNIDANWFADRAAELLKRRGEGNRRLIFIVDEVGQYVARSVDRMRDLQGLAEAIQKKRGNLWLVATSQETLNAVVDSLEGRQVELARVQARFPIRVDLLPADIDEVAGRRVLDKSEPGQREVRAAFAPHRNKLSANVRLTSPTRAEDLAEDEFVRLYPLLPYQIQLLIDAVSARRAQGRGSPMLGGSNRTIIKLAQQLVVDPKAGLGTEGVGRLATMDRAYQLLESIIPTSWQAEVQQVVDRYGNDSTEAGLARVLALCVDVSALPLDARNLSVLLHPSITAESIEDQVQSALEHLVRDEVIRLGDTGYRLQSPEEKDWEKTRRGIEPRPANRTRLRRELLRDALTGLSVTEGRVFKVAVTVEGERVLDGDIGLLIEDADDSRRAEMRTQSREAVALSIVWWAYKESNATTEALDELFRSQQIIERRGTAPRGAAEVELLGEERNRLARLQREALSKLGRDLLGGQAIFQGRAADIAGTDIRSTAQELLKPRVREIYPKLDQFCAAVTRTDVTAVLRADDLRGLPSYVGESGIGLTRITPNGVELALDRDPLASVISEIRQRASYGNEATGAYLEQHFGQAPYGAPVEVIQALVAASIRAGLVEAVHGGARLSRPNDPRLERVFSALPAFRSASFTPQAEDIDITARTKLAQGLAELTGERPSPAVEELSKTLRSTFGADAAASDRVVSTLRGLGLPIPDAISRTASILDRLLQETDKDAVRTASETWVDLVAGRGAVQALDSVLATDLEVIRQALAELRSGGNGLGHDTASKLGDLRDLLYAGDIPNHIAEIKSLTTQISAIRKAAEDEATDALKKHLQEERESLRSRFSMLDETQIAEALRPLEELMPPADASPSLDSLEGRRVAVAARAQAAARILEELRDPGKLAHLNLATLAPDPIESEDELEIILGRIRDAVQAQLAEGKRVQLS